jgi:hypothetical protein
MALENQPDWDAVERDYRAGVLSLTEICKRHMINMSTLKGKAADRGWTRIMRDDIEEAELMGACDLIEAPRFMADSLFDKEDLRKHALLTAGQVVREHRKDVRKLREISAKIVQYLEIELGIGQPEDGVMPIHARGEKESPADLLEKLSRVMMRTVAIERQAYGLNGLTITPDGDADATGDAVAREIADIKSSLNRITAEKRESDGAKKQQGPEPSVHVTTGAGAGVPEGAD